MNLAIRDLGGMTGELEAKLRHHGIRKSDQLLDAARTPSGRHDLARAMGVDESAILGLANRADLARVKGIGEVFSDLLEQAGVDLLRERDAVLEPLQPEAGDQIEQVRGLVRVGPQHAQRPIGHHRHRSGRLTFPADEQHRLEREERQHRNRSAA